MASSSWILLAKESLPFCMHLKFTVNTRQRDRLVIIFTNCVIIYWVASKLPLHLVFNKTMKEGVLIGLWLSIWLLVLVFLLPLIQA